MRYEKNETQTNEQTQGQIDIGRSQWDLLVREFWQKTFTV